MNPDSGLESAAGGAHAAKRPCLRRYGAAFKLTAPNFRILETEGDHLSEGEQLRQRLRQATPRTDHLSHSSFHEG